MIGSGALPPSYVRNVTFINATGRPLVVVGSFKSQNQQEFNIDANATQTIERSIDHGDYQTVDAIENSQIRNIGDSNAVLGHLALSSDSGVLTPTYRIVAGNGDHVVFEHLSD